jgi:hypothetical protein
MHYGEFANYAEYFALALIEGRANSPSLEEGVETLCVMEAVRLSARNNGAPVEVAEIMRQAGLHA